MTSKQKVKAIHPLAIVKRYKSWKGKVYHIAWTKPYESGGVQLAEGKTPGLAWKRAAERLKPCTNQRS
jgi:hypothetical protein